MIKPVYTKWFPVWRQEENPFATGLERSMGTLAATSVCGRAEERREWSGVGGGEDACRVHRFKAPLSVIRGARFRVHGQG